MREQLFPRIPNLRPGGVSAVTASTPTRLAPDLVWLVAALAVTMLVLVVASPYDLTTAQWATQQPPGLLGPLVQQWGTKPASMLVVLAAGLLVHAPWRSKYPLFAVGGLAVIIQVVLHPALVSNLVKLIWGRPRPITVGPLGEGFEPFHVLHPGFGDFSFPSGHVATAMVLAPCVLLAWREGRVVAAAVLAVITVVWAGVVAYGRVIHGAHFVTDVVFSVGLGLALAPLSLCLARGFARKWPNPSEPLKNAVPD